ncbi:MAG: hypothetical protein RBG13Loki_0288 [Promethearchaeota archaeon CR_4]|nr:MAG: hypothetical protein RBG13Loki_0288 [Candidatus Lokiarchaeota archaeon CR_4]
MPFLDGTGPFGLGSGFGRRRGWCFNPNGWNAPGYPGGRGMGIRWYNRQMISGQGLYPGPFGIPEITPEQNIAFLEAEKKAVETQLAAIEKELDCLKKEHQ